MVDVFAPSAMRGTPPLEMGIAVGDSTDTIAAKPQRGCGGCSPPVQTLSQQTHTQQQLVRNTAGYMQTVEQQRCQRAQVDCWSELS